MRTLSKNSKVGSVIGIGIFVVLALYGYTVYRFNAAVDAYALAARGHDTATYIPSAPDNATRRVLNRILADILTRPLTNADRIALAQEGLEALEVSETEIDAIGNLGENVTNTTNTLEGHFTLLHRSEKAELLALAARRFEIASDIRGLSYLANYHIAQIFDRVIRDGGEVTSDHTADLNRKIPEMESDFDKRANLYRELESTSAAADRLVTDLLRLW